MQLENTDRKLLNLIQAGFPLTTEPYTELGKRLGVDAEFIMERIAQLKAEGIIRLIGPVLDARRLGFKSTLVAMKVNPSCLRETEKVIAEHPRVSHGYEREHAFNVWFTLSIPPSGRIEAEIEQLNRATGADGIFSLPALKVYKIGAYFDMDSNGQETSPFIKKGGNGLSSCVRLNSMQKSVINELQQDLPLISMPFNAMAEHVDLDVERFLKECLLLQNKGVIRRFSASINHHRAGYTANGMACWSAPPNVIDIAGHKLALLKEVSHCYERQTNPLWRYNLFAMIHGRSKEITQEIVDSMSRETGLKDYALLYSTREFKKTRVKYTL